jgi:hypothetical protein
MKKTFIYAPVLLLLSILISCTDKNVEKKLSKIDSLIKVIDSVSYKLKLINPDTIMKRYHTFQVTNDTISKHFKELKNDESWKYICAYQNVRKPFKTMSFEYGTYMADIDSSIKQLNDLKHDVKEKLISGEEFALYYKNECKSANTVCFKISRNITSINRQMINFDTVHPYLIKLINDHKSGKKNNK